MRASLFSLALFAALALSPEAGAQAASDLSVIVLAEPEANGAGATDSAEPANPLASAPAVHRRPKLGGQIVLAAVGGMASYGVLHTAVENDAPGLLLLAPLASGAAVYGLGEMVGYDGRILNTMRGAAIGALPGVAIMGVGIAMDAGNNSDALITDGAVVAAIGLMGYVVGSAVGATGGYSISPAPHALPTGESVPGLSLRVGL